MSEATVYKLAPMAKTYATMTFVYFAMTMLLLVGIPFGEHTRFVGWALFALALVIWFFVKPAAFIADSKELVIRWRTRTRRIPTSDITAVERLGTRDLGWMLRIGVGGLWGGFGIFKTSKIGMIDGYFSTNEDLVLLRIKNKRPLLISPENPSDFLKTLGK